MTVEGAPRGCWSRCGFDRVRSNPLRQESWGCSDGGGTEKESRKSAAAKGQGCGFSLEGDFSSMIAEFGWQSFPNRCSWRRGRCPQDFAPRGAWPSGREAQPNSLSLAGRLMRATVARMRRDISPLAKSYATDFPGENWGLAPNLLACRGAGNPAVALKDRVGGLSTRCRFPVFNSTPWRSIAIKANTDVPEEVM